MRALIFIPIIIENFLSVVVHGTGSIVVDASKQDFPRLASIAIGVIGIIYFQSLLLPTRLRYARSRKVYCTYG